MEKKSIDQNLMKDSLLTLNSYFHPLEFKITTTNCVLMSEENLCLVLTVRKKKGAPEFMMYFVSGLYSVL